MIASSGPGDAHAREIAAGLAAAVLGALAAAKRAASGEPAGTAGPDAGSAKPALAWDAASDIAELLELPGLSALLTACEAHIAQPPREVEHALDRLGRLARETAAGGDVAPFLRADRELAAIAAAIAGEEWSTPEAVLAAEPGARAPEGRTPAAAPEALRPLHDLLSDFDFDDAAAIAKALVTMPVAAGLRAALDWIGADTGGRLRVVVHEASLTIVARAAHEPGLGPAGAVLALTGGALLPEPDGRWALRVPLHAPRPAFLLARQGELALAIPWHAVARLRIADEAARAAMTEPSLPPWSAVAGRQGERPAALLALGLTRAWLHLDHIVWRVFARPEPAEPLDAVPGGRLAVRTEDGEEFRVVEVDQALQGVPLLYTPPAQLRVVTPAAPAPPAPAPEAGPAVPAGTPPAAAAALPAAPGLAGPAGTPSATSALTSALTPRAPIVLGPESVRPLGARREAPAPAPPAAPPAPASTRALIVDDSLVARMELGRVLERRGWDVEWVETVAEMWPLLKAGRWATVFVDVSLPDASGRAHLEALVEQQIAARDRFELVALARDDADERLARAAGITHVLHKPFAAGKIERMIRSLNVRRR